MRAQRRILAPAPPQAQTQRSGWMFTMSNNSAPYCAVSSLVDPTTRDAIHASRSATRYRMLLLQRTYRGPRPDTLYRSKVRSLRASISEACLCVRSGCMFTRIVGGQASASDLRRPKHRGLVLNTNQQLKKSLIRSFAHLKTNPR